MDPLDAFTAQPDAGPNYAQRLAPYVMPPRSPARLPQGVEQGLTDATVGPIMDALEAMRGRMTPNEARDFAVMAALGMVPGARGTRPPRAGVHMSGRGAPLLDTGNPNAARAMNDVASDIRMGMGRRNIEDLNAGRSVPREPMGDAAVASRRTPVDPGLIEPGPYDISYGKFAKNMAGPVAMAGGALGIAAMQPQQGGASFDQRFAPVQGQPQIDYDMLQLMQRQQPPMPSIEDMEFIRQFTAPRATR